MEECHEIDNDDHSDESDSDEDEMSMAMQRAKISSRTVCMSCGGLGHGSSVDGVQCLTTQLGTKISRSDLLKIKYPNGITFPTFDRGSRSGKVSAHHITDDKSSSANRVTNDTRRKKPQPRHKSQKSKSDVYSKTPSRKEAHQSTHESPSQSGSSDESEAEAQFATVYHTIDVRNRRYDSYSSSNSEVGDNYTASNLRSATTKAKKK